MSISPLSQPGNNAIKPEKPTSVSASATAGGNATVSFTASTNPGKGTANYVATSSPGNITGSASSSPISIAGLTNGTAYTFTVVKQSGSGVGSDASAASGSITAYSAPTFGTQSGSSTATAPSASSTGVSSVSTTTATLVPSVGSGGTFYDYERLSGTAVTPSGNSLSGLAQKTAHSWRVRVTNSSSTFALTTRVTPNGSTTTVSVEYGTSTSYGTSAGSVNIGSGLSEVASSWDLGSSGSATIYYRITATYAGGATVQNTGSISRAVSIYNGSSVSFTTYGTYSRTSAESPGGITVTKPPEGVNITNISISMVGGGGGGSTTGTSYPRGGGGGGQVKVITGYTSTGTMTVSAPGSGGSGGFGGNPTTWTYYSFPGGAYTTVTAQGGTYGYASQGGASPTDGGYNYGYNPSLPTVIGGGGGGSAGAATSADGGPATTVDSETWGRGGAGYVNTGFGTPGHADDSCTAGRGKGGRAAEGGDSGNADPGYWKITYTGPAFT